MSPVVDHRLAERAEAEVMEILTFLIPVSLLLGGIGLAPSVWALKTKQFDDPMATPTAS
jgi:cbb3-type cytochrome oxidase maturation protein